MEYYYKLENAFCKRFIIDEEYYTISTYRYVYYISVYFYTYKLFSRASTGRYFVLYEVYQLPRYDLFNVPHNIFFSTNKLPI